MCVPQAPAPQPPPLPQPLPEAPEQEPGHAGTAVHVRVTLQKELPFGQSLKLVGSDPALGGWDESKGLQMVWGDGHVWSADVPLPPGAILEFKVKGAVLEPHNQTSMGCKLSFSA